MSMQTFSQLVDALMERTLRRDRLADTCAFVNQTLQEVGFTADGKLVYYARDLVEDQIEVDSEDIFTWTPPSSFHIMRTVRYASVFDIEGEMMYPPYLLPGRIIRAKDHFYYRAGTAFAFKGHGGIDSLIDVSYYVKPLRFRYFAEADRPASYDEVDGWTYHTDYDNNDTERATARDLVTNWRLFDYSDLIAEGSLAKLFKLVQDVERARTHYSMFQTQRNNLLTSELFESAGM